MENHRFVFGNPCKTCQWHIETDVRVFAVFDFCFQGVFLVPAILQIVEVANWKEDADVKKCDASRHDLAVIYSVCDVVNICIGIIADIILYFGSKKVVDGRNVSKACAVLFLLVAVTREALHITSLAAHIKRCAAAALVYELVIRFLCQYLLYGIWISIEYLLWLSMWLRPQLMIPLDSSAESKITVTIKSSTATQTSASFLQTLGAGESTAVVAQGTPAAKEREKKKRKSKKKTPENEDAQKSEPDGEVS